MQKIVPSLWFNFNAEDAVAFYTSIFPDSKVLSVSHYTEIDPEIFRGPGKSGQVVAMNFTLHRQEFCAINGGPQFPFTNAVSFMINCDSQEEVDRLWDTLLEGGKAQQCGWLTDKYGLSWQVVPTLLGKLMSDKDPKKVKAVTEAMLKMVKLESAELQRAYDAA